MKCEFALSLLIFATPPAVAQRIGGEWELHHKIQGQHTEGRFGYSVAGPGDLNDDGFPDILVGAPYQSSEKGMVYAYSGKNGHPLWQWTDGFVSMIGIAVSGAGDVNGDGLPDVLLGRPGTSIATVLLNDGTHWWTTPNLPKLGNAVSCLGDVNLDGVDDVIVGAEGYNSNSGRVYVFSGLDGSILYQFDGEFQGDQFGCSVGSEDVDGDGYPDILVGAPTAGRNGFDQNGVVYAYSGRTGALIHEIVGPPASYELLGWSIAGAGDLNLDGAGDFMAGSIGASFGGPLTGSVYVYSGLDGSVIFRIDGIVQGEIIGYGIDCIADIDFDQINDLAITVNPSSSQIGKIHIYSGVSGELLDIIEGAISNEGFGQNVATIGDITGDGLDEIMAGSRNEPNGSMGEAGAVYIYSPNPFIFADATELSASSGVPVQILMSFPESEANTKYALLLSGAGTGPTTIAGLEVPLGQSLLLSQMLTGWAPFNLHGAFGTLDANAQATATLDSDPTLAGLVGTTFYMAAVTYDSTPALAGRRTSIAWPIRITL
ncbi:MAG: hypothetical protein DWQ01_18235 [Planctomycetota bacterium]|nr:MAG: hypothetical protein DWQ01_18235 [Planctomycetota bacterium]